MKFTSKKLFTLILAGIMTVSVLTACEKEQTTDTPDETQKEQEQVEEVEETVVWKADPTNHWQEAEDGVQSELGEHVLEDEICTVCDFEIIDYEDGSFDVNTYNDQGDQVTSEYYENGELMASYRNDYTYDADGNILEEKSYTDGLLSHEAKYVMDGDGYPIIAHSAFYYDDRTKSTSDFNIQGDMIKSTEYDPDGNVTYQIDYQYEYDENGETTEYKAYEGDNLIEEFEYAYDDEGYTYAAKMTYYYDDGTVYVTEQNSDRLYTSDTVYDADGNIIDLTIYDYKFDENGNIIEESSTTNDVIDYIVKTDYDEEGNYAGEVVTTYEDDGSYVVETSDSSWNVLTEIHYAADGSVIEVLQDNVTEGTVTEE